MKVIELEKFSEDKTLLGKAVFDSGDYKSIHPGTIITNQDKPVLIYGEIADGFKEFHSFLKKVEYSVGQRTNQYRNNTEVNISKDINFGYKPKKPIYSQPAGACSFNVKYPDWYKQICLLGEFLLKKYEHFAPEKFKQHEQTVKKTVSKEWRIGETFYTQGVINNSNALGYHYDRDNFEGVWSTMAYFTKNVKGGDLIVPSLKTKILVKNETYILFDGQSLMHGVSPIINTRIDSYRYSIVYYSRKSMVGLGSYSEELDKIKQLEVEKHRKKLEEIKNDRTNK